MRIPREWRKGIKADRLLLLSPFPTSERHVTAALADEVYFVHITPNGRTARLADQVTTWSIPTIRYGGVP
jgi:hypothetical protein